MCKWPSGGWFLYLFSYRSNRVFAPRRAAARCRLEVCKKKFESKNNRSRLSSNIRPHQAGLMPSKAACNQERRPARSPEKRMAGKELVRGGDLGGRRTINKKKQQM